MILRTMVAEVPFSTARVMWIAGVLVAAGTVIEFVVSRSIWPALSLSFSGAAAIINFHWLEVLVGRVAQPGAPRYGGAAVLRIFLRMALLGSVLVALVIVPQADPLAIALGFSAIVVAILIEAFRWALKGGE